MKDRLNVDFYSYSFGRLLAAYLAKILDFSCVCRSRVVSVAGLEERCKVVSRELYIVVRVWPPFTRLGQFILIFFLINFFLVWAVSFPSVPKRKANIASTTNREVNMFF